MRWRLQRIGRNEVVVLEEVAAHFRAEEHYGAEHDQEHGNCHHVMHRVVRVEGYAIQRYAFRIKVVLDFNAVRIVGSDFVQGDDVRYHQADQDQRNRDHVEREEAVQGCIGDHVVAANPQRQIRADERNRTEQVDDNLRAPIRHLAPWQQIAHERFTHQAQENADAEQPHQFTRFAVRAVQQAAHHVQVDHDEEGRSTGRVHVAHQPAPRHIAHDVFDRGKRQGSIRLVMHDQENPGDNLYHQHQQRQRTEGVPEVEVLRCVVLGQVGFPGGCQRKTRINPVQGLVGDGSIGRQLFFVECHD